MKGVVLRDGRLAEAAEQFAAADDLPMVQLAYPRTGVWSGHNQLGFEIPYDPNATTAQTVLKLDEWGFPEVWTVSLGIRYQHELLDGEFFDCTAEIDFGSGGIMQTFDVDWVDGTVFSLPMNALNVRARWNDAAAALGLGAPGGIQISTILSRGAPARSRATLSKFFALVHAGESPSTSTGLPHDKIPRFAKSAQVVPSTAADVGILYGANFELSFFANSQTTNTLLTVLGNFLGPNVKVPIPPFARYYGLKINGAQSTSGNLMFNLFDE